MSFRSSAVLGWLLWLFASPIAAQPPRRVASASVISSSRDMPPKLTPQEVAEQSPQAVEYASWVRGIEAERARLRTSAASVHTPSEASQLIGGFLKRINEKRSAPPKCLIGAHNNYRLALYAEVDGERRFLDYFNGAPGAQEPKWRIEEADRYSKIANSEFRRVFKALRAGDAPAIAPASNSYLGYLASINAKKR